MATKRKVVASVGRSLGAAMLATIVCSASGQSDPNLLPIGFQDAAVFDVAPVGIDPFGIWTGDIDNDGDLDLVVAFKITDKVLILRNTGDWDPPSDGFTYNLVDNIIPVNTDIELNEGLTEVRLAHMQGPNEIGRASCRERVCQYV